MKKLMMTITLAGAVALSALCGLSPKSTVAEFRTAFEAALAEPSATNQVGVMTALNKRGFWDIIWARDPEVVAFRGEADEELAKRGVGALWAHAVTLPKVSALHRARIGAEAAVPVRLAVARRLGCDALPYAISLRADAADIAACLAESVTLARNPRFASIRDIDQFKCALQALAAKGIRKALRRQGKSFVTKDGVNPCETALSALNSALNAPRLAGTGEWLAEFGFADNFAVSLPSEAQVAKLKERVLDGDEELTSRNKALLYVCLGVEGYNAFVKEYNGD